MVKPSKPYKDFPLFPHGNGQWAKKIRGQMRYFGSWADPRAALENYLEEKDYWQAGRKPPEKLTTVRELLNAWLGDKDAARIAGEITQVTYDDYQRACDAIAAAVGVRRPLESLTYQDFAELRQAVGKKANGKQYSLTTLKRRLIVARMIFGHANEEWGYSLRFKRALRAPSKKAIREIERERGELLYEAADIRKLVKAADGEIKAIILLGINCAFGAADCCSIKGRAVNCEWHNYHRPKTQVDRKAWLWPETREAIGPTRTGVLFPDWDRHRVSREFNVVCEDAGVTSLGHYSLRRTFETIATTAEVSQPVIDHIMGHSRNDMASVYRQRIFDGQIKRCCEHVRDWYLGSVTLE